MDENAIRSPCLLRRRPGPSQLIRQGGMIIEHSRLAFGLAANSTPTLALGSRFCSCSPSKATRRRKMGERVSPRDVSF
jgi:hypothetical protein